MVSRLRYLVRVSHEKNNYGGGRAVSPLRGRLVPPYEDALPNNRGSPEKSRSHSLEALVLDGHLRNQSLFIDHLHNLAVPPRRKDLGPYCGLAASPWIAQEMSTLY